MHLTDAEFQKLTDVIKEYSGILLTRDKEYLIDGRLSPIVKKYEMEGLKNLVEKIASDRSLFIEVIEAITTNETSFFRDQRPFEHMRNVTIPELIEIKGKTIPLSIWSAACSTGQEPYSLAMVLGDHFPDLDYKITATDLDNKVLDKAKNGVYSQFEIQRGVPVPMLLKYFDQDGSNWKVKGNVGARIAFQSFNLLESPKSLGAFDMVMCRNVLIYFDAPTKSKILNHIASVMAPHAYLYMGSSESLIGIETPFKQVPDISGVYKLK